MLLPWVYAPSELCVSQVSDAQQRTSLEVELQQKQSQYRDCSGEPLTAAIRTSRNNIDFQGAWPIFGLGSDHHLSHVPTAPNATEQKAQRELPARDCSG